MSDKYLEKLILSTEKGKIEKEYWTNKLLGETTLSGFPKFNRNNKDIRIEYSEELYKIPSEIFDKLNTICNKSMYAMYIYLLSAMKTLLYIYCGNKVQIVAMPVFKQKNKGIYIENILPIKTTLEDGDTFKSFLGKVKESILEADKNQNFPIRKTAELLGLTVEDNKIRFNTVIAMENIHRCECVEYIKYDNMFTFIINNKQLELKISYNICDYEPELIDQIYNHLIKLLNLVLQNANLNIYDIDVLSSNEKDHMLKDFNNTSEDYSKDKTIHQLFEEQVLRTPDKIAVVFENQRISYEKLNNKANLLAKQLRIIGVKPGTFVGIMMERSIEMIVSVLAVLKSGGAYLPIDSKYPSERIRYMVEDSKLKFILTHKNLDVYIRNINSKLNIINLSHNNFEENDLDNIKNVNSIDDLAYIIYTSGSTGKPKGVMVRHRGIVNLKEVFKAELSINSNDRIIQFASFSFDAATWEIFMATLLGGTLYIISEELIGNVERFQEYLNANEITIATLPPVYLANLEPDKVKSLKKIITAGSATSNSIVRKWGKHIEYVNAYGPTEATICATMFKVNRDNISSNLIPIGKPIHNTKILILNDNKSIVPVCVKGEMYIAGDTLATGYLNKPELTAEKFIENPYKADEKIYCTGDLARWLPDGNIEFLGRKDNQVKVRGYRIEIGEIKNKLITHDDVLEAEVITINTDNLYKYLCAYVVLKNDISTEELKNYLLKSLPEYMVPAVFVKLEEMPMTINGKINKAKLPNPSEVILKNTKYVEPKSKIEKVLSEIWEEVLGIKPVGIKESFLELGGDSIKAIQVLSRLSKHKLKLELKDLFKFKTIEQISKFVKSSDTKAIYQGEITGYIGLTAIQKWFFERNFTNMNHWNQSVMLYRKEGFDQEIVKSVFNKIVEHHDALRIIYKKVNDKILQYNRKIQDEKLIDLFVYDYTDSTEYEKSIYEKSNELHSSMDLNKGPLVKLALFKTVEGDHLLISIHHLVVDGVSWRIILEDFSMGYMQRINNNNIKFQDKTVSFKEWSSKINEYANTKNLEKEKEYWIKIEDYYKDDLSRDNKRKVKDNKNVKFELSKEVTNKLLTKANFAYNTEFNDLLISALSMALRLWLNQDRIVLSIEGHGRENITDLDTSRTIGWFTSQYPVMIELGENKDISFIIKYVKEQLRKIPNRGINYGIIRYLSSINNKNELKINPEIGFNYFGQFDNNIDNDIFTISKLKTGNVVSLESENIFKININSIIVHGRMAISIIYNKYDYKSESIEKLKQLLIKNINSIVGHCEKNKTPELTPSDVGASDISILEFSKIYGKWGNNIKYIYNLSPTQEGMLYHTMVNGLSNNYFQQISFDLKGKVDLELLKKSFNLIIERHDALRTNFLCKNVKKPVQVVLRRCNNEILLKDISDVNGIQQEEIVKHFLSKEIKNGFDLANDRLIRIAIFKLENNSYKLIWSFHHIIMDGWCLGIINKELFQIYDSLKNNYNTNLSNTADYRTYIKWIEKQDKTGAKEYWSKYLEEYENKATIPKITAVNGYDEFKREEVNFIIDKMYTNKLLKVARDNNVTLNIVLEAIWGIIIQKYNDSQDIVFGNVVSGRKSEIDNVEEIIGLFINTIPVRVKCSNETRFDELLQVIQRNAIASEKFSYFPLVEIQELSKLKSNLFESIMVFENYPIEKSLLDTEKENGVGFSITFDKAFQQTNYKFNITLFPGEDIGVKITFDSSVYDRKFVENIRNQMLTIIEKVISNINIKVSNLSIVNEKEKTDIIEGFNQTIVNYSGNSTIKDLFEEQVQKTPNNKAVIYNGKSLTYEELNNRSNQLANVLIAKGVERDTIVAIIAEPSLEMVIGILGILKAGGAYLPIDVTTPKERINQIIFNSNSQYVLMEKSIGDYIKINIDTIYICEDEMSNYSILNPQITSDINSLAYVIYTSGTTGVPKGVLIQNKSVINYVRWFKEKFNPNVEDKTVLVSSFAFDLGYTVLFSSLLSGSQLHLLSKNIYGNPGELVHYLVQNEITYMKLTPSLFSVLINCQTIKDIYKSLKLRLILLGGEKIKIGDIKKYHDLCSETKLVNHYGPTEATIGCITNEVEFNNIEDYTDSSVIGKPISNTNIYILDKDLNVVPVGVTGEIYISGLCLAKGYINQDKMKENKFILNPFTEYKQLMYSTGDLGRYRRDGKIELLCRKDQQVKIRGYRVDIKEIETSIRKQEGIKDVVVLAKYDREKTQYLCAYVVLESDKKVKDIKDKLRHEMPDYMIPAYFIVIDEIPLTQNCKIDTKALLSKEFKLDTGNKYIDPRDDVEKILVKIWEDILEVRNIGIDDDFFEIGGHSLKVISLIAKIYEEFHVEISPKNIMESPTIRNIGKCIKSNDNKKENYLMLLNKKYKKNIFLFPPVGGYGMVYKNLADVIGEYSCYSFNYIPDSKNNILKYVELIKEVQKDGPYILMGWSAGGNLAYEVARTMEVCDLKISELILIDVHRIMRKSNIPQSEIKKMVQENLKLAAEDKVYKEYLNKNDFIKNRIAERMQDYFDYLRNYMVNSGKISADIHLILSEDKIEEAYDNRKKWEEVTTKSFNKIQGVGTHSYMLYDEFVYENVKYIKKILKGEL